MQLGRSLATQCLDQAHRGACYRSIRSGTFAPPTSGSILRNDVNLSIRTSIHHRCAFLSTNTCLLHGASLSKKKLYRPRKPKFRKIFQDQDVPSWTQHVSKDIESSLLSGDSGNREPQRGIELSSDFVDAFGIRKNSVQTESHALGFSPKPVWRQTRPEDGAENEQAFSSLKDTQIRLSETTTEQLEEELQWIARNEPNLREIEEILAVLVQDRHIKPASQHYEALILANCNPEEGSSENVAAVLEEMDTDGVDIDAGIYAAALNALAIHPSLSLTWSIISNMQTRWISQTPQMTHALITIFIRTSQLELANDFLNELHKANKPLPRNQRTAIPKYLYILLIRALVEKKDYEAVMRWLYRLHDRKAMEMDMPAEFWAWVLECAARDGEGWVTGWLWQDWVERMRVRPQRKTCSDVMQIAARDGVAWLAESVKDVICHGGFIEASRSELMIDKDWVIDRHSDNDVSAMRSDSKLLRPDTRKTGSSSLCNVDRNKSDPGKRVSFHSLQTKMRSSDKPTKRTSPKDTPNLTLLTPEEESLLNTAYRNCDLNINRKRGFKGLSDLTNGQKDGIHMEDDTAVSDDDGGDQRERVQRREQVKPGNLWPWFKNIEGYGNPRFDPWEALGPKSKS